MRGHRTAGVREGLVGVHEQPDLSPVRQRAPSDSSLYTQHRARCQIHRSGSRSVYRAKWNHIVGQTLFQEFCIRKAFIPQREGYRRYLKEKETELLKVNKGLAQDLPNFKAQALL